MLYILFGRHAQIADPQAIAVDQATEARDPSLSPEGIREAFAVMQRLKEELMSDPLRAGEDRISIGRILHGSYLPVRATAGILSMAIGRLITLADGAQAIGTDDRPVLVRLRSALDAEVFRDRTFDAGNECSSLLQELREVVAESQGRNNAILLVGHQPYLGWVASEIMRRKGPRWRPAPAVPFSRGELICVALDDATDRRPWLRSSAYIAWVIAPDDARTAELVREKIRRKMDIAGALAAVLTFALGLVFGTLLDPQKLGKLGVGRGAAIVAGGCLLAGLLLYLTALYSYDRLLMPDRFWGERQQRRDPVPGPGSVRTRRRWLVTRPPSSTAWVLYQNMMRVWRTVFTLATALVVLGLLALGYAAFRPPPWPSLGVAIGVTGAIGLIWRTFRPVLGSED